jgi:uncharacterized protein YciU (UPF0263 family)
MIRSLYDYYVSSSLNLEEVLEDYVDNFFLKKNSEEKAAQVIKKSNEITKLKELNGISIKNREFKEHYPNYLDFAKVIKSSLWFTLQSSQTKVLGVLNVANEWDKTINRRFYIVDKETFRNNIIQIFKEYQIMENVPKDHYSGDIGSYSNELSLHERYEAEKIQTAKQFEEGIRWFVWKTIVDYVIKFDMKRTDPFVKRQLLLTIDAASASRDIKRIARNLGIDWDTIVDKQIDMTLIMKSSSHISLHNADYGESIDTIKFLEEFEKTLYS